MLGKLYTIGYTGRTIEELAQTAKAANAMVVDVRLSARSRVTQWDKVTLYSGLDRRGVEYWHIPDLGNTNYKSGGPITLHAPETGLEALRGLLSRGNCVILCVCPCVDDCHRKTVADAMVRAYGVAVEHLPPKSPTKTKAQTNAGQSMLF